MLAKFVLFGGQVMQMMQVFRGGDVWLWKGVIIYNEVSSGGCG